MQRWVHCLLLVSFLPACSDCSETVLPALGVISAEPEVIDFGEVAPGSIAEQPVQLINSGMGTVTITNVRVVNNPSTVFTLEDAPLSGAKISGGSMVTFAILYERSDPSVLDNAQLEITSDANNAPVLLIPILARTGAAADAGVEDAGIDADAGVNEPDATEPDAADPDAAEPDAMPPDAEPRGCPEFFCSESDVCWETNAPQGNSLNGVAMISDTDGWAVGNSGTTLRYDGTTWNPVEITETRHARLRDVWAVDANDVWIAGQNSQLGGGVVYHFDGTSWATHDLGVFRRPVGIWASGPNDAWIFGEFSTSIARYNGVDWTDNTPPGLPINAEVVGLRGTDANNVWALISVGTSTVVVKRWDGTSWIDHSFRGSHPMYNYADAIAVWSPEDVWVTDGSSIHHFDGTSWTQQIQTGPTYGAIALADNDVWITGPYGRFHHFDGQSWRTTETGFPESAASISRGRTGKIWAVGSTGLIADYDGFRWQKYSCGPSINYSGISAADDSVFAVGFTNGPSYDLVSHQYDGTGWSIHTIPANGAAQAPHIYAITPDEAWVAAQSVVFRWNGFVWSAVVPPPGTFNASFGTSAMDVYLAGTNASYDAAVIQHWDGLNWSEVFSVPGVGLQFWRIQGSSPTNIWAVGFNGLVAHYDGVSWTQQQNGMDPSAPLSSVLTFAADNTWALAGWAWRWDGSIWSQVMPAVDFGADLYGRAPNNIWFATSPMMRFDGLSIGPAAEVPTVPYRVTVDGQDRFWALGEGIIHQRP